MFQCTLTGGSVECVHSSQECYVFFPSVCASAPSLGASHGGRIPDSSFFATSYYNGDYVAKHGRLHGTNCGWALEERSAIGTQHLQIDLGNLFWVCGVATQGDVCHGMDEWTTKYKISLSLDNSTWNVYQWNGSDKVSQSCFGSHLEIFIASSCLEFIPPKKWNFF